MKVLFFLLLSFSAFMMRACDMSDAFDDDRTYLTVDNRLQEIITVYLALGLEEYGYPSLYPDTALPANHVGYEKKTSTFNWPEQNLLNTTIPPNEYIKIECLDNLQGQFPDTLSVFIISADTLLKYGYNDVRENYRVIVRYDLAWEDVKKLNYIFPYPPTPDMKAMKMYPAYQEITSRETN
jgi:hypothetical protein